jgi:hypothetical protein
VSGCFPEGFVSSGVFISENLAINTTKKLTKNSSQKTISLELILSYQTNGLALTLVDSVKPTATNFLIRKVTSKKFYNYQKDYKC